MILRAAIVVSAVSCLPFEPCLPVARRGTGS